MSVDGKFLDTSRGHGYDFIDDVGERKENAGIVHLLVGCVTDDLAESQDYSRFSAFDELDSRTAYHKYNGDDYYDEVA
jgi:hypothetical protein